MELATAILVASLSAASPPPVPANSPDVIVRAERLICRPVTRTGTSAVCRAREQWESVRAGQYTTLDDADAKLEVISNPCGCN